jgi:cysteine desulfurase
LSQDAVPTLLDGLFLGDVAGIYLDHQATDRPRPHAIEAVRRCMERHYGNASALVHTRGQLAKRHLENFRQASAGIMQAQGAALCFTSGATESNNLVLGSEARRPGAHLIVSAIEHKCVLESALRGREWGARVSILPVDRCGVVDLEALERLIQEGATLVSVMAANNEVGVIQPIREIGRLCLRMGVRLHTDAAQAVGKMDLDMGDLGVDYLSITAHKFGGPQGIGAIVFSDRVRGQVQPLLVGGGQERGMRSGTTPIALCAGMAAASLCVAQNMKSEVRHMRRMRDRLLDGLRSLGPFFTNSDVKHGLCNNLSGGFEGISAMLLMRRMPEVHFSVGSACTSGAGASHVLSAMGLPRERIDASFRLSVGWCTTEDDVDEALASFARALQSMPPARARGVRPRPLQGVLAADRT